ncbi:MAG TPA: DNA-binding protein, partial [Bdellovibrionales bacterium]|nr:DNA-binding protein [Bdellovibrionales bacterium]
IMGKNWIHIQDGTGGAGENDLIITTTQEAALDQVVVVSGTLQYDKNIGSGYVFPAIIENGSVKVE